MSDQKSNADRILERLDEMVDEVADKVKDKMKEEAGELVDEVEEVATTYWKRFRKYLQNNNAAENTIIFIGGLLVSDIINSVRGHGVLLPFIMKLLHPGG